MEHDRKQKLLMIFALVMGIASLSVGFAAFSTTLNISSNASVSINSDTFSVKFSTNKDSLTVNEVEPSDMSPGLNVNAGIIDNSSQPKLTNLYTTFTTPGQYVEYTFYARNEGEYTAYLNSVNYFGEKICEAEEGATQALVDAACSGIGMTVFVEGVEYSDSTEITGHSLAKGIGEEIKVRLSYDSLTAFADGPFKVSFSDLIMVYSTIDDSTYIPSDSPLNYRLLTDIVKEGAISDISVDFASSTGLDVENNTAFFMNTTINDTNPIYYYRGNVTKNNVKFANYCWKMVRTTETGGVKLIYNGVPSEDGYCDNTGTDSLIKSGVYGSMNSPAYMGYMYGVTYFAKDKDPEEFTETYLYGNDVTWDGVNYTLIDTMISSDYKEDYLTLQKKYHYTCFNATGICSDVYYVYSIFPTGGAHYLIITDGKNIDDVKEEMFSNITDSSIKKTIDSWYASNMTTYTGYLEDTIWCNDRTIVGGGLNNNDITNKSTYAAHFATSKRLTNPSITCTNIKDSFTVDSTNGNGKLTYPVGLLTADEYTMAGSGNKGYSSLTYLYIGGSQWTMSPNYYNLNSGNVYCVNDTGVLSSSNSANNRGIRPAISLKPGTLISGGDGSVSNPYVVE